MDIIPANLVNQTHPQYDLFLPVWNKCRDLYLGEEAVKKNAHRNRYLLRPHRMADGAWVEYVERANLLGLFASTVEGRVGDVVRKGATLQGNDALQEFWDTMTLLGEDLDGVGSQIIRELLITGRVCALLDFSQEANRFYVSVYRAEDLMHWQSNAIGEPTVLVLREKDWEFTEHSKTEVDVRLVLTMEEEGYVARRYANKGGWVLVNETAPKGRGGKLEKIPAIVFNVDHLGLPCSDPPMTHLSNLIISLFRNSADYEQGLHALGVPTPVVTGIRKEDMTDQTLGPSTPIILEPPDAKVSFLEFSGQGLSQLKQAMDEKVLQAVMLGARLVQPRRQVESAESARTRMGAETSLLNILVQNTESGLYEMSERFLEWAGGAGAEFTLELNRDFVDEEFNPDALRAINDAELQGIISPMTAFNLRKRFEIYPDGWTFEEERDNLDTMGTDAKKPPEEPPQPLKVELAGIAEDEEE